MADALSTNGHVILSGILTEEREMMEERLAMLGWLVVDEDIEDIWWSATASPR